ncbi:MAG: transposase [Candidatus Omnitrophica bacterium]|nr:transposase [Candidatus Omnitrophota bacterium]
MPRIGRVVAVGLPHHITQRGNYQQDVFLEPDDRRQYLSWIREYSLKYSLSILVYCLMQNHVHFIAIPNEIDSLAKTFNAAHMRYSQYFNKKLKQRGHLWQGRFYSCVLDEPHLLLAARYIERNPVRAGLVKKPWQWPWSSAISHVNGKENGLIELGDLLGIIGMSCPSWEKYIDSPEENNSLQRIRKHTLTGHPLGTIAFIEKLEAKFGRRLCALPIGRPKKN